MRLNRYLAGSLGIGRRQADLLIKDGQVEVDGKLASIGQDILPSSVVKLDHKVVAQPKTNETIIFHKPAGIVVSRQGQGSRTIYDVLSKEFSKLKPVGRLDKDSSGLLILSSDGILINRLSHPSNNKTKVYEVRLSRPLSSNDRLRIKQGIKVEDYVSRLQVTPVNESGADYIIKMTEGRNRQIRKTFDALGCKVTKLHRTKFGEYNLGDLAEGQYRIV